MNRSLVVVCFLVLAFSPGGWTIGDQPDIATDEQQLADLSGNERVDKLNDLAFAQWSRDPQKGLGFAHEAQKLAQKIGYKKGEARALNGLGVNNWGLSDHRLALECYLAAFDISRDIDDGKGMSNSLNNIGIIYTVLGSYEDSLGYFTQSLEIQKKLNDKKGMASTLNNVGLIYERLKSPQKATEYYTQSLEIRREIADQRGIASSLNNLGSAFQSMGKYSEALGSLTEALLIFRKIDDPAGIASTLVSHGDLYATLGHHKGALEELTLALALSEELGDRLLVATCLHKIGRSSIELEQPRYERYRRPFCVIMSDIDDFKSINDKYGHGIGDEVLKGIAGVLRDSTRNQDTVARWGGEEFILLLPETQLDRASAIAERIRKNLETWSLNTAEGRLKVTITLGVAEYASKDYPEDCIRRADAALYEGKAAGKNRVIVSCPESQKL